MPLFLYVTFFLSEQREETESRERVMSRGRGEREQRKRVSSAPLLLRPQIVFDWDTAVMNSFNLNYFLKALSPICHIGS